MTTVARSRPANAPDPRPPRREPRLSDLCHWVLSVQDWQAHALVERCEMPWPDAVLTRCQRWHLAVCGMSVARRDEVCARCMAGGVQHLEVLPARTAAAKGHPW